MSGSLGQGPSGVTIAPCHTASSGSRKPKPFTSSRSVAFTVFRSLKRQATRPAVPPGHPGKRTAMVAGGVETCGSQIATASVAVTQNGQSDHETKRNQPPEAVSDRAGSPASGTCVETTRRDSRRSPRRNHRPPSRECKRTGGRPPAFASPRRSLAQPNPSAGPPDPAIDRMKPQGQPGRTHQIDHVAVLEQDRRAERVAEGVTSIRSSLCAMTASRRASRQMPAQYGSRCRPLHPTHKASSRR